MSARRAPGPMGHPLWGSLPAMARDPVVFLADLPRAYGDVARYRVGLPGESRVAHLLRRPDHVRRILVEESDDYPKNVVYSRLKLGAGDGLLTSEGEAWRRQRRAAQPAFAREHLATLAAPMAEETAALFEESWDRVAARGEAIEVAAEMARLGLRIAGRTLLGVDARPDEDELLGAVDAFVEHFKATMNSPLPFTLPFPLGRTVRTVKAFVSLSRFGQRAIDERRRNRRDRRDKEDLVSCLLRSRDERTGVPLSDKQLRVELLTFLLAGYETTAVALAWSFYLLAGHPHVAEKLVAELDRVLAGRPPTAEDMAALPFARMVIEEAMRLYPPSWSIERRARREAEIDGYRIPQGSLVVLCPWAMQRDEAYWDEPLAFRPERFGQGTSAARPRYAYFPFGAGPRVCIGSGFAMLEAQIVLAMVAQRYTLERVEGHVVEPQAIITLRPRHGIRLRLRRRSAVAR